MNVKTVVAGLLLSLSMVSVAAERESFEVIVLTDTTDNEIPSEVAELRTKDRGYRLDQRRFAVTRNARLERRRRILADMAQSGVAVVDDAGIETFEHVQAKIIDLPDDGPLELAYNAVDLQAPIFSSGELIAKRSMHRDKGRTYQMSYVYRFPDLGVVYIDELNYANVPNMKVTVAAPAGNLYVNGNPATYLAVTNEERSRGTTTITFYTDSKLITVVALQCITRDDENAFGRLMQLTSSLY